MITAKEARELVGPTPQERVDMLDGLIREAVLKKQRNIRLHDWWAGAGYSATAEWQEAVKILESLGYKVKFYYRESQFVDMYTIVEW